MAMEKKGRKGSKQRPGVKKFLKRHQNSVNSEIIGSSGKSGSLDICPPHPGYFKGLCMRCWQLQEDDGSGVAFRYIHKLRYLELMGFSWVVCSGKKITTSVKSIKDASLKDLKLGAEEIERLREIDLKNLLREKKLILILYMDHTLLYTTRLLELQPDEQYLLRKSDSNQDSQDHSWRYIIKMQNSI